MTEPRLRLLCFDGGGVRGLASLYVLQSFLATVGDPLPCRYFDMIAGTSTGGLIAIMLGRLELSVEQCIETYTSMMDAVFQNRTVGGLTSTIVTGQVKARYSSAVLKTNIQRVIEMAGLPREALIRHPKNSGCKTFVVAVDESSPRQPIYFTDYPRIGEQKMYKETKIWEAALATSAVPSFFDGVQITVGAVTRKFLDGGLGHNNPVFQLWQQAEEQFGSPIEPQIRSLVSIGTGRPRLVRFGSSLRAVAESIRTIALQTESTAASFGETHSGLLDRQAHYRLNPEDIDVLPDAPEDKGVIAARAEAWLRYDHVRRLLREFQQVAGAEPTPPHLAASPLKLFYKLDGSSQYLGSQSLPSDRYWQHLTLESWEIYNRIYEICKDPNGFVPFPSFAAQFPPHSTDAPLVESTWRRLLQNPRSPLSPSTPPYHKGFVFACLYMLHVERFLPHARPQDDARQPGIKAKRREWLKRYGNWVACRCGGECSVEWNFANDEGIWRPFAGGEKCRAVRDLLGGWRGKKGEEVRRELFARWEDSRAYPQSGSR